MKLLSTIAIIIPCIIVIFLTVHITGDCNNPAPNSCNFYTDCLEKKFHCGATGYQIKYGLKYCEKFKNSSNLFTSRGKKWITDTMLCLQNALVPTYNSNATTCSEITKTAFDSHPDCYVNSGLCNIPKDWYNIFATIGVHEKKYVEVEAENIEVKAANAE
nr:150_t:CDS:2 [Entrophospora candida]